jgi:hypothetical protein
MDRDVLHGRVGGQNLVEITKVRVLVQWLTVNDDDF